uniref:O-acyltransferase WSD1 C-terminal domain-containing protein n=1 Tax=Chenopodium quinoa TaxID=63459 RepID=A0A803L774_CHEQI
MKSKLKIETKCKQENDAAEPVSPTGQYLNSKSLNSCILAILESDIPIDESCALPQLRDVFLPINPRFSSIMIDDKKGVRQWKKVEVNLQDHVYVPRFPEGLSSESYDDYFDEYLTKISVEPLPQDKPIWELHIINCPTSKAAGHIIFKLHHALGDGYSLMGALLSCVKRADNPSLPLTFPSTRARSEVKNTNSKGCMTKVPRALSAIFKGASDFGYSFLKSTCIADDQTPIRCESKSPGSIPLKVSTVAFSLNQIKLIKKKLGAISRYRNSPAIYLTAQCLEIIRKYKGSEAVAKYIHSTLSKSSMSMTNMIGPVEQVTLAGHPIKGMYFMVTGSPQSLVITVMSYTQTLRIGVGAEKGFIDSQRLNSCIKNAFELIYEAATKSE